MPTRSSGSVRVFWPDRDKEALLEALGQGIKRLAAQLPLVRVVLFGSQAAGTATVASDVDVLVVYEGEPRDDAYALTKRAFAVPRLEPHVYSEAEYAAAASTLERMVRNGVTVFERASDHARSE